MSDYSRTISAELGLRSTQVQAVIEMLDDGNTIPFIARYRKERTGSLDEDQLRRVNEAIEKIRALDARREVVLHSIEEQGKLTEELRAQILAASSLTMLEDLYQPYKPKRKTRASVAKEKGLQGLAIHILNQELTKTTAESIARSYLNDAVPTIEEALQGARDIVAETISDHPQVRQSVRTKASQWGIIRTVKVSEAVDERQVYQIYYDFECRVDRLRPHQVLAFNRGEFEKVLRVSLEIPERDWREVILLHFRPDRRSPFFEHLMMAVEDAAGRLLLPAIERDVRRSLKEKAEAHAIQVFASNLRALLNQPPISGFTVLGIDPGFRSGCKIAIVDPTGKLLETGTIYPHEPQRRWEDALACLQKWVVKHNVGLIAIGNGTASRETERLAAEVIKRHAGELHYLITNEAGASVYSASPLARSEFPDLDVSLRGAISIARRVQDPLAELVKIDPKSIGVGLYQHDVGQVELGRSLSAVVESVVNQVGVNVNTASPALLTYIAGIGPKLAEKIVSHRDQNGLFRNRGQIREVPGLGPKAFEQAAGFLRVIGGDQPLDASAIHPESYPLAEQVLKIAGIEFSDPALKRERAVEELRRTPLATLAQKLDCGVPTLEDILEQLVRPGRDPRLDLPTPILRSDVLSMEDLIVGMRLKGTVRNLVDFGAFIDIGVKYDGLLHRSQMPPGAHLEVAQIVEVVILKVEADRGRIALGWSGDT